MRIYLLTVLCFLLWPQALWASTPIKDDSHSAVILAYHRIGEDQYPDTNLRLSQFQAHLKEIQNGNYNVLPLETIIDALQNGEKLPPKTIAITFAGAYKSALTNAMPTLLKADIPFTIFFASDHADRNAAQHLNWRDLTRLSQNKNVSFGLLPAAYIRLAGSADTEILTQINKAKTRFREKLDTEPVLFSYPFGEYSLTYKKLISDNGFKAAFGLQSGSISTSSDFFALPRFTMTESFGDLQRFRLVTEALPLPVSKVEPKDPYLDNPEPQLGFSILDDLANELGALSCFVSGQTQPKIELLSTTRVELRLNEPLSEPRTRVNCTLPGPPNDDDTPRWRWFGMLLVQKDQGEGTL